MTDINFIRLLPKAELHVHIEGTLEPELMFKMAERNKITIPYKSVEEVRAAYQFSNLQDFLDIYYAGAGVLQTEEDFYDLAMAYFDRAAADGVVHAEVFFDPQTHTDRGIPYASVIEGLADAAYDAQRKHHMSVFYIHSFLRHLSEEKAFVSLAMAEPYLNKEKYKIIGVGLDSSERGHPPEKFARVFKHAADKGLFLFAHAGEEGPASYVWQALDGLKVDRIDHGNRALEDSFLVPELRRREITLTVCPLSNTKLCVVPDMAKHPIKRMLKKGLKATVNSDDPAYFGGYIVDNFVALVDAGVIDLQDCVTLARNSFMGSFLSTHPQKPYLIVLDEMERSLATRPVTYGVGVRASRLES